MSTDQSPEGKLMVVTLMKRNEVSLQSYGHSEVTDNEEWRIGFFVIRLFIPKNPGWSSLSCFSCQDENH